MRSATICVEDAERTYHKKLWTFNYVPEVANVLRQSSQDFIEHGEYTPGVLLTETECIKLLMAVGEKVRAGLDWRKVITTMLETLFDNGHVVLWVGRETGEQGDNKHDQSENS